MSTPADTLSDAGMTVSIANPAQIKEFGRGVSVKTKNNTEDSLVLARFGALRKPVAWTPLPAAARQLQAYVAREDAIEKDIEREQNRKVKSVIDRAPADVPASIEEAIEFLNTQLNVIRKKIQTHTDRHSWRRTGIRAPVRHQHACRPRLFKAGPKTIRAALYTPAITALKWNPHIQALKERLTTKNKMSMAIVWLRCQSLYTSASAW